MSLRIAVIYEDDSIMVQMTPEEFVEQLQKVTNGVDIIKALDSVIKELKKKTNVL